MSYSKKGLFAAIMWGLLALGIFAYLKVVSQSSWSLAPQGNRFDLIGGTPVTSESATIEQA